MKHWKKFETIKILDYFPAIHSCADYRRTYRSKRKRKKTTLSLFVTIGKILKKRYTEKNRVQLISRDIKESGSREDRIETVFVEIILLIEPTRYKYTYNRNRLRTKSTNCYPHPLFDIQICVLSRLLFSLHFVGGFARYSTRAERERMTDARSRKFPFLFRLDRPTDRPPSSNVDSRVSIGGIISG